MDSKDFSYKMDSLPPLVQNTNTKQFQLFESPSDEPKQEEDPSSSSSSEGGGVGRWNGQKESALPEKMEPEKSV